MKWLRQKYWGFRIWYAKRFRRPMNVRWFGAHPDADGDTNLEAFRRAIDAAHSTVVVPPGIHKT